MCSEAVGMGSWGGGLVGVGEVLALGMERLLWHGLDTSDERCSKPKPFHAFLTISCLSLLPTTTSTALPHP